MESRDDRGRMGTLSPQAELSPWLNLSPPPPIFSSYPGRTIPLQAPLISFPFPIMKKFGEGGRPALFADPSRLITCTVAVTFSRACSGKGREVAITGGGSPRCNTRPGPDYCCCLENAAPNTGELSPTWCQQCDCPRSRQQHSHSQWNTLLLCFVRRCHRHSHRATPPPLPIGALI